MQDQKKIFTNALTRLVSGLEKNNHAHQTYDSHETKQINETVKRNGAHYHESWELKIPLKGRLHCRFEKQNFDIRQNSTLLIAPKSIHHSTSPEDIRRCHAWLNFLFENGDVHLVLVKGRSATHYVLSSDQKSELIIMLGHTPNEFCGHIALVLVRAKKSAQKMASNWLSLLFSSLLNAINLTPASSPQHELVSRTLALLNNMSHDATLTVRRTAKILNVSPKYMSFVFSRQTGVSPRQKLIRIRLERAFRLLQTGKFSVKEVAAFTGWKNQFYFSSSFRRHYGIIPSQIHKRIIQN